LTWPKIAPLIGGMSRAQGQIPLHYLFAHNGWATEQLLSFCERLSRDQLAASAPGSLGTVFETLHHFIQSEGGYVRRAAPGLWPAGLDPDLEGTFPALWTRARELERMWGAYASTDPDAAMPCYASWNDRRFELPVGVQIVQALHHSHAHREQVCTVLTSIGLQSPDLQGWVWGEAARVMRPSG